MNRIEQAWRWVRESPAHWAIVGAVALAAVVTGTALALAVGNLRDGEVGSAPSATPEGSTAPSASVASAEPSASVPASESPSLAASDEPSPTATAMPTPNSTPVPTPDEGYGGGGSPVYDITGSWQALPAMPGGSDFMTADALWLPDGRVVVFRWDYGSEDPADPEVVAYDPASARWETVTFSGARPFVGTDQSFVLANDGFIHSFEERIAITDDTWRVEPYPLITESDVWAGSNLAGADGLIYRRAQDATGSQTQLMVNDLDAGTMERTASMGERLELVHAAPDGTIMAIGGETEVSLVPYDPASDRWAPAVDTVTPGIDPWHVAVGPDGDVYAPSYYPEFPGMFAISPTDGSVRSVQLPEGVSHWDVDLLWADDGRLYAFGYDDAWVFTPDR